VCNLTELANLANIVTAAVAIGALLLAYHQVTSANKISRESAATELYNQGLSLALQYPNFANPDHFTLSEKEYLSYRWFVASLLLSSEQILIVTNGDKYWRNSVKSSLRRHSAYLAKRQLDEDRNLKIFYDDRLVAVANEIVAERGQKAGTYA
jgi:ribonucleotide monophosphatase NagD (HAD superfamily)